MATDTSTCRRKRRSRSASTPTPLRAIRATSLSRRASLATLDVLEHSPPVNRRPLFPTDTFASALRPGGAAPFFALRPRDRTFPKAALRGAIVRFPRPG